VCREVHRYFVNAANKGETRDLERLQAFAVSQQHARSCAGLIAAVHMSTLRTVDGTSLVGDFEGLDAILQLANTPAGLINQGESLQALRTSNELVLMDTDATEDVAADANAKLWHCPNCHVSELDTNMDAISVYGLSRPTCNKWPGTCWCEKVDVETKYCKLCVNTFRKRHEPRSRDAERRRISQAKKRKECDDLQPSTLHIDKKSRAIVPVSQFPSTEQSPVSPRANNVEELN